MPPPRTDYEHVARVWHTLAAELGTTAVPNDLLAASFAVPRTTVINWIHTCRRRGLIPPSERVRRRPRVRTPDGALVERDSFRDGYRPAPWLPDPPAPAPIADPDPPAPAWLPRTTPPDRTEGRGARVLMCDTCLFDCPVDRAIAMHEHCLAVHGRRATPTERTPALVTVPPADGPASVTDAAVTEQALEQSVPAGADCSSAAPPDPASHWSTAS